MKLLMDVQGFKILCAAHPAVLHCRTLSGSHMSRLTEMGAGQKVALCLSDLGCAKWEAIMLILMPKLLLNIDGAGRRRTLETMFQRKKNNDRLCPVTKLGNKRVGCDAAVALL
jgi:hypothetical protein